MSRVAELYIRGMTPSAVLIGLVASSEGVNRKIPFWKVFTFTMVGTVLYPLTMSYFTYRLYKDDL
ncbi:Transmembrane domain-containing protein [Brazilian cedratvirus IHUMI]|uniref:Transmembrane domain-containing protein n=1 Tax=Brazilian cedratvirus IHUMI TaxID=2126980 RepID=A0A2R8FDW4_9VIRU|nr:Transmembrane domain-containing protein [Brazilian cedratvirus IHUMI]